MADGGRSFEGKVTITKMPTKPTVIARMARFTLGLAIMLGCSYAGRTFGMPCGLLVLGLCTMSYIRGAKGW